MKIIWKSSWLLVLVWFFASCAWRSSSQRFVLQRIPIQIQPAKSIVVTLKATGGNQVGIRCSPELWNTLTNGTDSISVRMISSNKGNARVGEFAPGAGKVWPIESFHYLFNIYGEQGIEAEVEMTFRNSPPGVSHAEIIVCKATWDFGL